MLFELDHTTRTARCRTAQHPLCGDPAALYASITRALSGGPVLPSAQIPIPTFPRRDVPTPETSAPRTPATCIECDRLDELNGWPTCDLLTEALPCCGGELGPARPSPRLYAMHVEQNDCPLGKDLAESNAKDDQQ